MPPKSDLLCNKPAAALVMKWSSQEIEKIATGVVNEEFLCVPIGFCIRKLTTGVPYLQYVAHKSLVE